MSIRVLRAGLLASIQDLGRHGYQKYGIIVSGAMDTYALRIANFLVGNEEEEGALEITLLGPSLKFEKNMLVAITGGNLSPTINGQPVPMWRPVYVRADSILRFGACKSGCRAYLAVAGGYDLQEVMGSKSTYLRAGIGGFQGRALQVGDVLQTAVDDRRTEKFIKSFVDNNISAEYSSTSWYIGENYIPRDAQPIVIRITEGNQFGKFTESSRQELMNCFFGIKTQSDRMGYRLSGSILTLETPLEMISEAVTFGTVQVPPDGNPIILLADRQTAGGYPKIAQTVLVDLPVIAQARPGNKIHFQKVSLAEAEELYLAKGQAVQKIKLAIRLKMA